MQHEEEMPYSLGVRLARLLVLWLFTTMVLGLCLILIGAIFIYLEPYYSTSLFLPMPLLWGYSMHKGVPIAQGGDAKQQWDWVVVIYLSFVISQLVVFGGLLMLVVGAAMGSLNF